MSKKNKKIGISKDELIQLYVNDKQSAKDIAKKYNCTTTCISNYLIHFKINKIPVRTKILKEDLIRLNHVEKKSCVEISKIYKRSVTCICNYFKKYNIVAIKYIKSTKGIKKTKEHCKKMSDSRKGMKLSQETKNKISKSRIGTSSPNKGLTKDKNPEMVTWGVGGENHWNWKGGISLEQTRLRQTSKYKQWRTDIYIRDNYTCIECGHRGCVLNVHHKDISFKNLITEAMIKYPESNLIDACLQYSRMWELDIGTTLCVKCHKKHHTEELREQMKIINENKNTILGGRK